jgi:hypothetical protein
MSESREDDENVIDTEEASAGGPQTHDPAGTRLRAETPGLLTQEELDERQEKIRETRRKGGPDLTKKSTEAEAEEDEAPDVPPTETEEPPGPPPPPTP